MAGPHDPEPGQETRVGSLFQAAQNLLRPALPNPNAKEGGGQQRLSSRAS